MKESYERDPETAKKREVSLAFRGFELLADTDGEFPVVKFKMIVLANASDLELYMDLIRDLLSERIILTKIHRKLSISFMDRGPRKM